MLAESRQIEAVWQEGQAALQSRDYQAAESAFRRVVALDPSLAEAFVNLGLSLHLQRKAEEAIPCFQQALKLQPALTHAYLFLGINLFNLNQISKALPVLEKYTFLAPKDPQGHYYLGITLASLGDSEKATGCLETASRLAPRDMDTLYHLAQSYISQASSRLRLLAQTDPSLPLLKHWEKDRGTDIADLVRQSPADLNLGGQLIAEGKEREALTRLKPRLGRSPPDRQAEQLAMAAYASLYVKTTRRFYQIEPDSFRIHQLLAAYYEKTHQPDKAIVELKQALAKNPNVRGIHFTLGSIYQGQASLELALAEFQKELQIASPYPGTRLQLAQVYLTLQQPEKALEQLLILQHDNPEKGEVYSALGKAYSSLGQNEKAAKSFEQAIAGGETTHAVFYQLAHVYRKLGQTEMAAKYFEASQKASEAERTRARTRIERDIKAQGQESPPKD